MAHVHALVICPRTDNILKNVSCKSVEFADIFYRMLQMFASTSITFKKSYLTTVIQNETEAVVVTHA